MQITVNLIAVLTCSIIGCFIGATLGNVYALPLQRLLRRKKGSGFICGAWRKTREGPLSNSRFYVMRCDLEENHDGKHLDRVLLVNWSNDECDPLWKPTNRLNS